MNTSLVTLRRSSGVNTAAGFTIVELLVVIAIIGVLVGLLLPAIQSAREAGRRSACANNIKQLALGLHSYHDVHNILPSAENKYTAAGYWQVPFKTWFVDIMPYIEMADASRILRPAVRATNTLPHINRSSALVTRMATGRVATPRRLVIRSAPVRRKTTDADQKAHAGRVLPVNLVPAIDGTTHWLNLLACSSPTCFFSAVSSMSLMDCRKQSCFLNGGES
jgi:prepilin-type N-terminal cleavage/methylation domain-containing protein